MRPNKLEVPHVVLLDWMAKGLCFDSHFCASAQVRHVKRRSTNWVPQIFHLNGKVDYLGTQISLAPAQLNLVRALIAIYTRHLKEPLPAE